MATIRIRADELPRLKSILKKKAIGALNNHEGLKGILRGPIISPTCCIARWRVPLAALQGSSALVTQLDTKYFM